MHGNPVIASDAGIRVHAVKGSRRLDETIQSGIIAMAFSTPANLSNWLRKPNA
ncbi:MAG: hypothetical protein OXI01_09935 [Albidovulum sp.]|nr:hypothetical protein [Albidovulum sp.]